MNVLVPMELKIPCQQSLIGLVYEQAILIQFACLEILNKSPFLIFEHDFTISRVFI